MTPGRPDDIKNPCPPAALLKISIPLKASLVKIALAPLVTAWASLSLSKTPLFLASLNTSQAVYEIFSAPKKLAKAYAILGMTFYC